MISGQRTMKPAPALKWKAVNFAVGRIVVLATCVLLVGAAAALLLGKSLSTRSIEAQAQRQQGKMLIVRDEGLTCQQMSFDNRTGHIVSVQTGSCRDVTTSQSQHAPDPDTPLGSIRKALNGR
jgi:hypothetical protein